MNRAFYKQQVLKKVLIFLFVLIVIYFFSKVVSSYYLVEYEVDSLTYHIPLAQNFAALNFLNLDNIPFGLGYYPGIGEIILAFVVKLFLPLSIYNLLLLVLLFFSLKSLFRSFSSNKNLAIIFAVGVCLLPTIVRLIPNQKIDILVLIFFAELLKSFIKLDNSSLAYLKVGIFAGLLIGTKYPGILYAATLLIVFIRDFFKNLNFKKAIYVVVPVIVFGFSWYLRNYFVKGNPFYPTDLFGYPAHPNFFPDRLTLAGTIFAIKGGWWLVAQTYISEYFISALAPLIMFVYLIYHKFIKKVLVKQIYWKLFLVFVLNFLFLLPQPGGATFETVIQVVRFSYPAMIPAILGVFLIAQEKGYQEAISIVAVLSAVSVLPLLNMYPKLIFIWLLMVVVFLLKKRK